MTKGARIRDRTLLLCVCDPQRLKLLLVGLELHFSVCVSPKG